MNDASLSHRTQSPFGFIRRVFVSFFVAMTGAYGLSISGFLVLRAMVGESLSLIGLVNSYVHLLLIPATLLLPLSLLLRKPRLALTQAAPALAFLTAYGALFLPRATSTPADAPRFTILTYNLNKENLSVEAVETIIRASGADVVALQELNPPMAEALTTRLVDLYLYSAMHPQADYSGQGVLSRYPLSGDMYWQDNLGHQRVQVDWTTTSIVIYNAHPSHPLGGFWYDGRIRRRAIADVLNRASRESLPVVLAGDFNMTDQSADYGRVTASLVDSYREIGQGLGFTFPEFKNTGLGVNILPPLARIDYVFHDAHFAALDAQVVAEAGGSDHHPLRVVLGKVN